MSDDVLAEFEPLISAAEKADAAAIQADPSASPWGRDADESLRYEPNVALLEALLTGPLQAGASTQSGRLAKAFDAWMAYELRRARFHPAEVWPRNEAPRVSSREVEALREKVDKLQAWVDKRDADFDKRAERLEDKGDAQAQTDAAARLTRLHSRLTRQHASRVKAHAKLTAKAAKDGKPAPDPLDPLTLPSRAPASDLLLPGLRQAINGVVSGMPNVNATNVLGRFYVKQVDVVVSAWDRGPDVLISGKSMFSSFAKNTKNRYEETLGEASNLRDRYPLAAMGYAFLVSDEILAEAGAYARLQDLLLRTRKPHGPYDATMLLIASWDSTTNTLQLTDPLTYPDPAVSGQQPPVDLRASTFFTDLLNASITNTPVGIHQEVRDLRNGTPIPGGVPNLAQDAADDAADEDASDAAEDLDESADDVGDQATDDAGDDAGEGDRPANEDSSG